MIQPITLIDESVAPLRTAECSLSTGMLLTLVRHACARRQNKSEGHVLHCTQPCRGHVHRYSPAANKNRQARQTNPSAGRSHAPRLSASTCVAVFREIKVISVNLSFSATSGDS